MKRKQLNGYWLVYVSEHPGCMRSSSYNGWEYEHKYLVEVSLGRLLNDDEIVHHIDHDRSNNELSNLMLMTRSEHGVLHERERGHLATNRCVDCGKEINAKATRCKECDYARRYGTNRPSEHELEQLIVKYNNSQIAAMYGVSDKAVSKWRQKYGLPSWNEQHGKHRGIKSAHARL